MFLMSHIIHNTTRDGNFGVGLMGTVRDKIYKSYILNSLCDDLHTYISLVNDQALYYEF